MTVSIIIPVFNERDSILKVLDRIKTCGVSPVEIVVVDDGSTDGTREVLAEAAATGAIKPVLHERNKGKGAAVATGIAHATGDIVVIQDADLEYDPRDLPSLVSPIIEDLADVVFGSRFAGGKARYVAYHRHRLANRLLTALSNFLSDLDLTDMECGYKAFRRTLLTDIEIEEPSFGFEPEITAKIAKKRPRVYEVAVSYHARTFAEGKKISWTDGFIALYAIVKYNLFR
ncbi:MAG TPA: glycosyltransferase family 2 protein [Lacipirellulaceae bacterium]|jgi:glycosyltransferase involved in cell wall biosynthesis